MTNINAVIFDVYETLVHHDQALWLPTFDDICQEQGLPFDGRELWERWKPLELRFRRERYGESYPFKSYEHAWRECFERVFLELGCNGDASAPAKRMVLEHGQRAPYPETHEAIARLHQSGKFLLGVLSNADNGFLEPLLGRLDLPFDATLSSESASAYKPEATAFNQILASLNVAAEESLYVGDSQFDDVQGAKGVGMRVAWVNRSGTSPDPSLPVPDYVVSDLLKVLDILGVN